MTYSTELVENKRIDGKPRQRVIAFLGGIKQSELASFTSRYYFWYHLVTEKMKEYPPRIPTTQQQHAIFEALHKKVLLSLEEFAGEYECTRHAVGEWSMPVL